MADDWLKLYRKTLDSAVFESDSIWRLWGYLLMSANWERRQIVDGTVLEPGQMVRGYRRIAEDLGWSRSKVERWAKTLERLGNIRMTPRSGTLAQVITVCNWETYQSNGGTKQDTTGTLPGTLPGRYRGHYRDENKKERKKEGKKERKRSDQVVLDDVTFPEGFDTPEVRAALVQWCEYKRARREAYKAPARQLSLLLAEERFTSPADFVAAVRNSVANNYVGCFPPKGDNRGAQTRISPGARHDPERPCTPL